MQSSVAYGDASVAVILSELPAYQRWQNRPLNPQYRQMLRQASEQELMSLAAAALQRILDQSTSESSGR